MRRVRKDPAREPGEKGIVNPDIESWAMELLTENIREEEFRKIPKGKGEHMRKVMGDDYVDRLQT